MRPGLERIRRALDALGRPDRDLAILQVAGTVGKGSTAAIAAAILQAAGLRTGLFTSPHLVRVGERVRIDGVEAEEHLLLERLEALRRALPWAAAAPAEGGLTFFEWCVLLALFTFREAGCEAAVLEVGMGGRWDATSAAHADVVALTRIGLDHQRILGPDLVAIAGEKAATLRAGVREGVTAGRPGEALHVFTTAAARKGIPLRVLGRDFPPRPCALAGAHQEENAGVAAAAAKALSDQVDEEAVARGLSAVRLPGRLQCLGDGLWLDGAHNPDGARALADALAALDLAPVHLVFGCLRDREPERLLAPLLPLAETVSLVAVASDRALPPATYCERIAHRALRICTLDEALLPRTDTRPTVVCGSLYLVGEVLARRSGRLQEPGERL